MLVTAVAGCGEAKGPSSGPPVPVSSPTAIPSAEGLVTTVATVQGPADGSAACLAWSWGATPEDRCGSFPVLGWDWAEHPEAEVHDAMRTGTFTLTGEWDGTSFRPTQVGEPTSVDAEPLRRTPCEAPAGGWSVLDPETTDQAARNALSRAAARRDDYGTFWVDQSVNPASERFDAGDQSEAVMAALNDPALTVMNVGVTGDPDVAEAELREVWGGMLCVYQVAHTEAELQEIATSADPPGLLGSSYGGPGNVVSYHVVHDDGSIQSWFDQEHGEGLVEVTSAMTPAG